MQKNPLSNLNLPEFKPEAHPLVLFNPESNCNLPPA